MQNKINIDCLITIKIDKHGEKTYSLFSTTFIYAYRYEEISSRHHHFYISLSIKVISNKLTGNLHKLHIT